LSSENSAARLLNSTVPWFYSTLHSTRNKEKIATSICWVSKKGNPQSVVFIVVAISTLSERYKLGLLEKRCSGNVGRPQIGAFSKWCKYNLKIGKFPPSTSKECSPTLPDRMAQWVTPKHF